MKMTKFFAAALLALALSAWAQKPPAKPADHLLPAEPAAAWEKFETAAKPPPQPAEWASKPPTEEQQEQFRKLLGEKSAEVAAMAREFYTRFPDHANAEQARTSEKRFLQQAVAYGNLSVKDDASTKLTDEQLLEQKINGVHRSAGDKRKEGKQAVLAAFEAGIRGLMKDYPNSPELWQQMFIFANNADHDDAKRVFAEIVNSTVADQEIVAEAKARLKLLGAVGQPLDLKFTAADGREVDVQKMKGKVVLIDFWASWCGPCIASLPEVLEIYEKLRAKGFEIVGINLDKQRKAMDGALERFNMTWPQYFDGLGWGNKLAREYNVTAIPSMWLVDKAGKLRTLTAREDLEQQITALMAEKI